ncbi:MULTISPECIES: DUF2917 domain-containing protein [unclassified Methylibium]|jgi:Protein of unknown function (DUF2917)|uniref:DUF2917 domain-containing protein n=1 Tax=unclassified Methylibium TaxID=2633235 RepID=UPI0003F40B50|nr:MULTISPECIES: DUF2917 domain-containing protein [unclassified Methylibium]EWS55981.1 hypothetical protein X551_01219 [Methylibium sp. T29]EWS62077.1 hypothetical protein Y694_00124 [Methylibium sp. T29-B]MBL8360034.1 DUF2917 domain-containing protein [Rubrivivax sp.]
MNAMKTPRSQPFGIGTRTEIRLDDQHLLTLSVRAGDLLRSAGGTVWATVDGEPDDILLAPGDVHVLTRECELRVSAFGHARLEVYGHGPLHYRMPRPLPARGAFAAAWNAMVSGIRPALGSIRALAGST